MSIRNTEADQSAHRLNTFIYVLYVVLNETTVLSLNLDAELVE
jgi:hypothetical protein